MYEVVDTQDHMEQVLTNDKCGCGGMEEMEVGGNTVVGDDTEVTKTCATNVQQGGTLGDFDHMRENVRYSGGDVTPLQKFGNYQFVVTIIVVFMCIIVFGIGCMLHYLAYKKGEVPLLTIGVLQILLGFALTIVYIFDVNEKEDDCRMYNTLKLISVSILCIMLFFKSKNEILSVFVMILGLMITLLMISGMLNIIEIKGMKPDNIQEYITRFLSALLYLSLWITKIVCISDKRNCISDLSLLNQDEDKQTNDTKTVKGNSNSMNGGRKKKRSRK
jgi:hypothetical protein